MYTLGAASSIVGCAFVGCALSLHHCRCCYCASVLDCFEEQLLFASLPNVEVHYLGVGKGTYAFCCDRGHAGCLEEEGKTSLLLHTPVLQRHDGNLKVVMIQTVARKKIKHLIAMPIQTQMKLQSIIWNALETLEMHSTSNHISSICGTLLLSMINLWHQELRSCIK